MRSRLVLFVILVLLAGCASTKSVTKPAPTVVDSQGNKYNLVLTDQTSNQQVYKLVPEGKKETQTLPQPMKEFIVTPPIQEKENNDFNWGGLNPFNWSENAVFCVLMMMNTINLSLTLDIVQRMEEANQTPPGVGNGIIVKNEEYFYSPVLGRSPSYNTVVNYYAILYSTEVLIKFLAPDEFTLFGWERLHFKKGWKSTFFLCMTFIETGSTLNTVWLSGKIKF